MAKPAARSMQGAFAGIRSDYEATQPSYYKRTRTSGQAVDADHHFRNQNQYFALVEMARQMEMNSPLISQGFDTLVSQVNPGAMRCAPKTGNPDIDGLLLADWEDWGSEPDRCDAAGERSWRGLSNLAYRRRCLDGDVFAIRDDTADVIKVIENHRCRSPHRGTERNWGVCGIALDPNGKPTTYYFTKADHNTLWNSVTEQTAPILARDDANQRIVFHYKHSTRFTGRRGVTCMAAGGSVEGMRDDLEFATLVAAKVQSCVTMWKTRALGGTDTQDFTPIGGDGTTVTTRDGSQYESVPLAPGLMDNGLLPGEDIKFATPNIPAVGWFELQKILHTYLAVNVRVPRCALLLDATDGNLSQWRGVMQLARDYYRDDQLDMAIQWHAPVYRWRVRQALAANKELQKAVKKDKRLNPALNGGDWRPLSLHLWHPEGWDYIDPDKDAKADERSLKTGCQTLSQFAPYRWGRSRTEFVDEYLADLEYAATKAHETATRLKTIGIEDATWRDFCPWLAETKPAPVAPEEMEQGEEAPAKKQGAAA